MKLIKIFINGMGRGEFNSKINCTKILWDNEYKKKWFSVKILNNLFTIVDNKWELVLFNCNLSTMQQWICNQIESLCDKNKWIKNCISLAGDILSLKRLQERRILVIWGNSVTNIFIYPITTKLILCYLKKRYHWCDRQRSASWGILQ